MANKILIICGPTATGKTKLAFQLAKKFDGELISADSRQIYKGMDIGTGKDLPANVKLNISDSKIGYYEIDEVPQWGYDLVKPTQEFSVASYQQIARSVIKGIWKRNRLPIVVGGTGLYIKAIVDGIETASISPDKRLRETLSKKSTEQLFEILSSVDFKKAAKMNDSDRKNPRRLIRAIEVAQNQKTIAVKQEFLADVLFIGLELDRSTLFGRIEKRVQMRIEQGFEREIETLLKNGVTWSSQSMSSLGYRQWHDYVDGTITRDEALKEWIFQEQKYAKRQVTWFKKDSRIHWFNVESANWVKKVEELIKIWHNNTQ